MSALLSAAWGVLGAILPAIIDLLKGGASPEAITDALIAGAQATAHHRVEARAGTAPHPLLSIALRLEDLAALLLVESQPILAAEVQIVVKELRRRAAAAAPTEPAPVDTSPTAGIPAALLRTIGGGAKRVAGDPARRLYVDRMVPAESAIRAAMLAVESMGADVRLTAAIEALATAREHVGDYVDSTATP